MVDLNSGNIDVPPNMTSWPSFHNGVAAGLKIAPASQVSMKPELHCVFIFINFYGHLNDYFIIQRQKMNYKHCKCLILAMLMVVPVLCPQLWALIRQKTLFLRF